MLKHAVVALLHSGRGCYKPAQIRSFINVGLPADCRKTLVSETCQACRRAVLLDRWIARSVPLEIAGSIGHEKVPTRKTGSGATRKTKRRDDRRIVRQALVDLKVTRSTMRADVGEAIVPQTISTHLAEANLNPSAPSVHSL
ncbi:hypothetical protein TNCV_4962621 [Trichonephila clavipes]|nr:hypothetical protein TNCV_4962621 [Trichonephila clavipes]